MYVCMYVLIKIHIYIYIVCLCFHRSKQIGRPRTYTGRKATPYLFERFACSTEKGLGDASITPPQVCKKASRNEMIKRT